MPAYTRTRTFLIISALAASACELGEDRDPPSTSVGMAVADGGVTGGGTGGVIGGGTGGATGGGTDAGVVPPSDGGIRTIDNVAPLPLDVALPIVFVHGYAGSAQQYYSQAIRFEANGYPVGRIRAFEHHGGQVMDDFASMLNTFVDGVLAEFKVPKVYLVGHSRGTSVSSMFLGDPARAAKVAKYISLDGFGCSQAATANIPCIAPSQATLVGQSHVEVATSLESFVEQYKFLIGSDPKVTAIVKQTEPVVISGRAVNFPENTGRAGTKLEIYEINAQTGARIGPPVKSYDLTSDGNFGPLTVSPDKRYEMVLSTPQGNHHHHYMQSFLRSSPFVRLLSGPPDTATRQNTNTGPNHSALIAMRMREWQTSDQLEVGIATQSNPNPQLVNVLNGVGVDPSGGGGADIASLVRGKIGIHLHDDVATPLMSSLVQIPYFMTQPFQAGVDVYLPAAEPPNGTIIVKSIPRGNVSKPQTIAIPNWPSTGHLSTLMFADYAQD
jgi:pimeloyl-ACP methyl ester carboxylesterase